MAQSRTQYIYWKHPLNTAFGLLDTNYIGNSSIFASSWLKTLFHICPKLTGIKIKRRGMRIIEKEKKKERSRGREFKGQKEKEITRCKGEQIGMWLPSLYFRPPLLLVEEKSFSYAKITEQYPGLLVCFFPLPL